MTELKMADIKQIFEPIILLSITGLLVACGGGGGGSGDSTSIGASAPMTVTSANATQVAGASIEASDSFTGNTEGILGVIPAAVGSTPSTDINIIETVIEQIKRAPQFSDFRVAPAAVQSESQNCDSGTLSLTFNDADNDLQLSTGDTVSMTASNCVFGDVTMNGGISISNVIVDGDQLSPPYSLQFSLQTSGFSVSAGGEMVSMNGGGTISESANDDITSTSSFSGNGIEITAGGDTLTLTDYQITETENQATNTYSRSINATISSSSLGGSVRVTTDVALSGVIPFDPDTGQITCMGNNSSVTLTVIDSTSVQLEVDEDGDNIVDNTWVEAWTSL
jgi:hypothetical protein